MSAVRIEFDYDPTVTCSNFWDGGIGGGKRGRHGNVERYPVLDTILISFPRRANDLAEILGRVRRKFIIAPGAPPRIGNLGIGNASKGNQCM